MKLKEIEFKNTCIENGFYYNNIFKKLDTCTDISFKEGIIDIIEQIENLDIEIANGGEREQRARILLIKDFIRYLKKCIGEVE